MTKEKTNTTYRPFVQFLVLTFSISWLLWSPFYFSKDINELWALPGAWGPTLAALIVTALNKGKTGVKMLLNKLLIWRVSIKYYVFAVGVSTIVMLVAILLAILIFNIQIDWGVVTRSMGLENNNHKLAALLLPVFFLITIFVGGPIAEELGWRGLAQEELQKKYGQSLSGLVIGFFWFLWHLPIIVYFPQGTGHMPVLAYAVVMTSMGVIFAWLYNRTKGSVLLAILLHAGMNFMNGVLGAELWQNSSILIIYTTLVVVLAIVLHYNSKLHN